jgi:aminoglycoside phosphotransferase (APT) family kinase protein
MKTKRLHLKPIDQEDLDFLYNLDNHKTVNRYRASDTRTREFCYAQIENWTQTYTDEILTVHVVSLSDTGEKIGLVLLVPSTEGEVVLGYRFFENYWNNGYAYEAVSFLLTAHFKTSNQRIVGDTHSDNESSMKLLAKLGFVEVKEECEKNMRIFALTQEMFWFTRFNDIPLSEQWRSVEHIDKGWSDDQKYHIVTETGQHLLLRISQLEKFEEKRAECEMIKQLSQLDFEMSKPYDFGVCREGVYMLLGWVEGDELEEVIASLKPFEQYKLGYESGQILNKIHGAKVTVEAFDWAKYFSRKMDQKIEMYEACSLKYDKGHIMIDYLNRSRSLLENRPIALQHGDYHVGNMIYSKSGHVAIIDFNRMSYGDPWEEFNRIVWDTRQSHAFARGRVDGYFDNQVPPAFFELMAVYIASNTLGSLPWSMAFGEAEIEVMKIQARDVLHAFDDFKSIVPRWYSETIG